MLPRRHRITKTSDFALVTRRGRKTRRGCLLVYSRVPDICKMGTPGLPDGDAPTRMGLIVSRRVGNSVVRHRVSRVLRHQIGERILSFDPGMMLIVRVLPAAGTRSNAGISRDLTRCLDAVIGANDG